MQMGVKDFLNFWRALWLECEWHIVGRKNKGWRAWRGGCHPLTDNMVSVVMNAFSA